MKTRILSLAVIAFSLALSFTSCKKDSSSADVDFTDESTTLADDQARFSSESDAVANDADLLLEATDGFTGRTEDVQSLICDATVAVDTMSTPRTITITYNGENCAGTRTRSGVVVISMADGVRWKNAGAALNVTFQNLRITRTSDSKSITINGTQTYTNVSGGLLINLPVLGTITHTITSSDLSVTFDNTTQRSWQVARQRVFSYNNGGVVTITGMHTEGSVTGIAEWGTNRFGNTFTTAITEPLIIRQDCSLRLTSGRVEHATARFNTSVTFGLDASGNATSCPGNGNYYMKIIWTGPAGNAHTTILPY